MGVEIERKFLVSGQTWKTGATGVRYRQGYLASGGGITVRVRVGGNAGYITVKGRTEGISRPEYEYAIPAKDADEMIDTLCAGVVEKVRYEVAASDGMIWEVDEFLAENEGLIVAEIELDSETQSFTRPAWVADEVTGDKRYYNAYLAKYPYRSWGGPREIEDRR